jgi:hypothetical protein
MRLPAREEDASVSSAFTVFGSFHLAESPFAAAMSGLGADTSAFGTGSVNFVSAGPASAGSATATAGFVFMDRLFEIFLTCVFGRPQECLSPNQATEQSTGYARTT